MTQLCFVHFHLCLKKIDNVFWTLWEKNSIPNIFIFPRPDSLYTTSKCIPYQTIFPTICNLPGPFSIYFWQQNVQRGWLNLNPSTLSDYYSSQSNYISWILCISDIEAAFLAVFSVTYMTSDSVCMSSSIQFSLTHYWVMAASRMIHDVVRCDVGLMWRCLVCWLYSY